jgi:hypothetical protein
MNQTFIDSTTLANAVALAFPLGIIFGILIGKLK